MSDALEAGWNRWFGQQYDQTQLDSRLAYAAGWADGSRLTVRALSTVNQIVPALRALADALEDDD